MKLRQIQKRHEDLLKARDYLNNIILNNKEIIDDKEIFDNGKKNKLIEENNLLALASEAVCSEAQRLLDRDWK